MNILSQNSHSQPLLLQPPHPPTLVTSSPSLNPPSPHPDEKWTTFGHLLARVAIEKCDTVGPVGAGVDGIALTQDGFAKVPSPAIYTVTPKAVDLIHTGRPVETGVAGTLINVHLQVKAHDTER